MNTLPENVRFYKYIVDSFYVLIPGEKEPIKIESNFVNGLTIEKDFDNHFFPILKINLSLKPSIYYSILKHKLNVKFKIRMQKYIYKNTQTVTFKTDTLNDIFCVYLNENTPFTDEKLYDETKNIQSSGTGVNLTDFRQDYTFYLFKESDITNSKNIVNSIISKGSMTDALAYILCTNGFTKVLLSPLNNKTVYEEILIQPLTVIGNLLYLEQQFGFYVNGAQIFFDHDVLYILERNAKCLAWRVNEFKQTVFMLKDILNAETHSPGSIVDEATKTFYINVTAGNYQTINRSVINDQVDGNNLIVINPIDGNVDKIESNTIQRGIGTYKVVTNKYVNKMAMTSERSDRNENSRIININIGDFDIDALTPNKEFKFIFESKKINSDYGGSYRMSKEVIEFVKKGDEFHVSGNCFLKRQIG